MMKYILLDYFFLIFHALLIVFNVFGWLYKPWVRWNLFVLLLTGFSWVGLGYFYGWGYCPLTDWHWDVLSALGIRPAESSYIQYLFNRILNIQVSANFADTLTLIVFLVALICSIIANIRLYKAKSSSGTSNI